MLEIYEDWISSRRYLDMEKIKLDEIKECEFEFTFLPQMVNA